MLDNPEKTAHLLAALKAAVPFEVELPPMVVKQLQADKVAAAHQTRQTVSDLSYLGDEGGIMCHIVPPGDEAAIIISLTHVRVSRSMPAGRIRPQLSEASSEEDKEAGPLAVIPLPPAERVSATGVMENRQRIGLTPP